MHTCIEQRIVVTSTIDARVEMGELARQRSETEIFKGSRVIAKEIIDEMSNKYTKTGYYYLTVNQLVDIVRNERKKLAKNWI